MDGDSGEAGSGKRDQARIDVPTVIAIAVVAYAAANILHEAVGHGKACWLAGGKAQLVSSLDFVCDQTAMTPAGKRLLAAGGTLVNVAAALPALIWYLTRRGSIATRYFLWLFWSINLMQAAGYLFFSGVGNVGDWAVFARDLAPAKVWRPVLAVIGGMAYWFVVRFSLRELTPFLGVDHAEARRRMTQLAVIPYLTGGALYCVSGVLNPEGWLLVLISGAAASLGGTSGLAWMGQFLRDPAYPLGSEPASAIERRMGWIIAAFATAVVFVGVLGPGIGL